MLCSRISWIADLLPKCGYFDQLRWNLAASSIFCGIFSVKHLETKSSYFWVGVWEEKEDGLSIEEWSHNNFSVPHIKLLWADLNTNYDRQNLSWQKVNCWFLSSSWSSRTPPPAATPENIGDEKMCWTKVNNIRVSLEQNIMTVTQTNVIIYHCPSWAGSHVKMPHSLTTLSWNTFISIQHIDFQR